MDIKNIKIILASQSPRRRELLEQIGISFEVRPSEKEEIITEAEPHEIVRMLALQKAEDIAEKSQEDGVIIGADTIVLAKGSILGKPKSPEDARRMLNLLRDNVHEVYTGAALIWKEGNKYKKVSFAEKTKVYVYPISDAEISEYIESKEPMDKAGAYGIQGRFGAFIQGIEGDYTNVVGLPVGRIYQELKALLREENQNDR